MTLRTHLKKHEKVASREEQDPLDTEGMYPDTNVGMNLALDRDLPEDTSQIIGSVADSIGDGTGSSLIVIHNSRNTIHDPLHGPTSADIRLDQNIVGSSSAAEGGGLSVEGLTPETIFHPQSENEESCPTHQFASDPSTVVTGMDGDCIEIFVQENLN